MCEENGRKTKIINITNLTIHGNELNTVPAVTIILPAQEVSIPDVQNENEPKQFFEAHTSSKNTTHMVRKF